MYFSLNTTVTGRIQDGTKLFAGSEGAGITWGENIPVWSSSLKKRKFQLKKNV